ncbi:unnamed protein product [Linum trigynum]|uniref:Uncharacterized protein n=1 Tax=Linum trigynum TaxID=586398 RepID=A0AAV2FNJ7_9ROSI
MSSIEVRGREELELEKRLESREPGRGDRARKAACKLWRGDACRRPSRVERSDILGRRLRHHRHRWNLESFVAVTTHHRRRSDFLLLILLYGGSVIGNERSLRVRGSEK